MNEDIQQRLQATLAETNWDYLDQMPPNDAYNEFNNQLQEILNEVAPIKTIKSTSKWIKRDPWITKGILKSSRTLDKLHKKKLSTSKTHPNNIRYVTYRNIYNRLKRFAKQLYYQQQLQTFQNDIRKTWRVLNTLIGKQNDKSHLADSFKINDREESDPSIISNGFCNFFAQIGSKYANGIAPSIHKPNHYLGSKTNHNLFLGPTDKYEIIQLINNLTNKSSCGKDGISPKLLKIL